MCAAVTILCAPFGDLDLQLKLAVFHRSDRKACGAACAKSPLFSGSWNATAGLAQSNRELTHPTTASGEYWPTELPPASSAMASIGLGGATGRFMPVDEFAIAARETNDFRVMLSARLTAITVSRNIFAMFLPATERVIFRPAALT